MKIKILLVDDSKDSRIYVTNILTNYNVLEAKSGKEALEIINHNKIDLLIADYNMPEMDGFDLVSIIKKNNHDFPIIIITGMKSLDKKKRMLRLGIDNYLYKPFFKEELISIIERAIVYHKTVLSSKSNLDIKIRDQFEEFKSKLEKILYENVDNFNFSVESIAREFAISTKTLTRRTKAIFGQTPNQLLIECRLNVAQEIISQNPRISLKETAKKVGLKNTTYLKNRLNEKFH